MKEQENITDEDIQKIITKIIFKNRKSKSMFKKILYLSEPTKIKSQDNKQVNISESELLHFKNLECKLEEIYKVCITALNMLKG